MGPDAQEQTTQQNKCQQRRTMQPGEQNNFKCHQNTGIHTNKMNTPNKHVKNDK